MKCVFTFLHAFCPKYIRSNILGITLEVRAQIYVALHGKCPLHLSDLKQKWSVLTNCTKLFFF
jgi:hypothetical protein